MFENLRHDFRRCGPRFAARLREAVLNPAMWAVFAYRFRRWVFAARLPRPLRWLLNIPAYALQVGSIVSSNVELPSSARIGSGLCLPHTGYVVVGAGVEMGDNCLLTQGVTIGHGGGGNKSVSGYPRLGHRVYVGPGAIVLGPIVVGDDALIGPGAVVTRSVPACGVVVGNPARLHSLRGSFDLIWYPGAETDPLRLAALARVGEEERKEGAAVACAAAGQEREMNHG
jgi:serine O-acetyltransferase